MCISRKYFVLVWIFCINLYSSELKDLLDNLNDYSDKNHLNIDYKPTAMTVLYSQNLEILGITTLSEALDFVAGIQTFKTTSINAGAGVSIRGYSQTLNIFNEKIKYRINGISVYSNYLENFPISIIERIEISKGNASTIYDRNGFVAVIDIITKDKNSVSFATGSFENRNFALVLNEKLNKNWNFKFDTNYLKHNKKVDAPSAILTSSVDFGTTFDRKQESLEGVEDYSFGATLQSDNFKIFSRYIKNHKQNNYGFSGFLDFNDEGYTEYEVIVNEIEYTNYITSNNILESKIGILQNNYQLNTYLYKLEPNNFGIYNPHFKVDYTQRESYLSLVLKNSSLANHNIEYGIYSSIIDVPKNKYYANVDNFTGFGMYVPAYKSYFPIQRELKEFSGKEGFINYDGSQTNFSYFLNDTYIVNNKLSLLVNFGIDTYEGNSNLLNFRVGSVYSNDNVNIFKFTVSQANRNPSLLETSIVGHLSISENKDLKAEKLQSTEFMYIYQQNDERLSMNLFFQKYIDGIDGRINGNTFQYYNKTEDDNNYGLELEYSKSFSNRSKLLFNGSYNVFEYKNKENLNLDIRTPIVSETTFNLGYIYPINSKFNVSSYTRYYGKKSVIGNNDDIPEVVLFDLGMQYNISKNAKIFFNIKNLFDRNYYHWGNNTTNERMLREGRTWFTSFSYDF